MIYHKLVIWIPVTAIWAILLRQVTWWGEIGLLISCLTVPYYTNSSWHWGPFGPKYHELFVILYTTDQNYFNQKPMSDNFRVLYHIGLVSMLVVSAVDLGFEPRSGPTKDYEIGICCFSAKHTALRRKNKNWLAQNQNNVSEWSGVSTRGLLFQWASTIKIQLSVLV
jgi:hypothetical protein